MLRVKALQVFYSQHQQPDTAVAPAMKELEHSLARTYDLYLLIIKLLIDLGEYAHKRVELAKNKKLATAEDLSPNMRFVENKVIKLLEQNKEVQHKLSDHSVGFEDDNLVRNLFKEVVSSEAYQTYMNDEQGGLRNDKNFILHLLAHHFNHSEELFTELEKKSIFWNDDIEFALAAVYKTINNIGKATDFDVELLPMYYDQSDYEFVKRLVRHVIMDQEKNQQMIRSFIKKWDIDRLAVIDMLIMSMAITEVRDFESIPVKVSLNEYIELAKYYGSPKSTTFINGVLDKIVVHMRDEGMFEKQGRGLIGNAPK